MLKAAEGLYALLAKFALSRAVLTIPLFLYPFQLQVTEIVLLLFLYIHLLSSRRAFNSEGRETDCII